MNHSWSIYNSTKKHNSALFDRKIEKFKWSVTNIKYLPTINNLRVLVLKPSETLSERSFDFAFNRIHFIASNPLLPLKFRIRQTQRLWKRRPRWKAFTFLQLQILRSLLYIWRTIASKIIRLRWSIVAFYLHHLAIGIRFWSLKIFHEKWGRKRLKGFLSLYNFKA